MYWLIVRRHRKRNHSQLCRAHRIRGVFSLRLSAPFCSILMPTHVRVHREHIYSMLHYLKIMHVVYLHLRWWLDLVDLWVTHWAASIGITRRWVIFINNNYKSSTNEWAKNVTKEILSILFKLSGILLGGHVRAVFAFVTIIFIVCVSVTINSFAEVPLWKLEAQPPKPPDFLNDDEDEHIKDDAGETLNTNEADQMPKTTSYGTLLNSNDAPMQTPRSVHSLALNSFGLFSYLSSLLSFRMISVAIRCHHYRQIPTTLHFPAKMSPRRHSLRMVANRMAFDMATKRRSHRLHNISLRSFLCRIHCAWFVWQIYSVGWRTFAIRCILPILLANRCFTVIQKRPKVAWNTQITRKVYDSDAGAWQCILCRAHAIPWSLRNWSNNTGYSYLSIWMNDLFFFFFWKL